MTSEFKKKGIKILFLVPYPIEGASCRFRVYQYLPFLRQNNIQFKVRPFISSSFYKIVYKKGFLRRKIFYTLAGLFNRLVDLVSLYKYDLIFIHLESSPFPLLIIERIAKLLNKPIIFDYDDAVFLKKENSINALRNFFNPHKKVENILSLSSEVIVCNQFLKEFSKSFVHERHISIIHTAVNVTHCPVSKLNNSPPIIGWIGSHSTFPYLENILDIFSELSLKYNFKLKIIGAPKKVEVPGVNIIQKNWSLQDESTDFSSLDIGIYPLVNTPWAKGKAGFKAIQFMAAQVPCVVSNIGMNKEFVIHGENGFLVDTKKEWVNALSDLINSPDLRKHIGQNGRKTAQAKFSLEINTPQYLNVIQHALNKNHFSGIMP